MSHIKDAKPEPLAAEEEATLRTWSATEIMPTHPSWKRDVARLLATLDAARADLAALQQVIDQQAEHLHAARAETEAVRRENRTALNRAVALDDLAAEMVEGLALAKRRFELLAAHDNTMRNGVRPSVGALEAEALIARARALSIGGEKEKAGD